MHDRVDLLLQRIGERIATRRKKNGLTQSALGAAAGLSRVSVSNIEGGKQHVALGSLLALADALDVEIRDLIPSRRELTLDAPVIMASPDVPLSGKNEVALDQIFNLPSRASEEPGDD